MRKFTRTVFVAETPDTDRKRINSESIGDEKALATEQPFSLKLVLVLYYLYYSLMHILVMLLIMTMNGYVVISIVGGMTIGYMLFEEPMESATAHEEELPVNCGGCE